MMLPDRQIQLIALDLDGTLLNSHHQLTERTIHTLRRAMAQGVQVVLATGKTRHSAQEAIQRLGLQTPGVFLQGLVVANADGSIRRQQALDAPIVGEIAAYARQRSASMVVYSGNAIFTEQRTPQTDRLIAYHEPIPQVVTSFEALAAAQPVNKVLYIDNAERVTGYRHDLTRQLGERVTLVQALADMLEILPPGASKGAGLRALLDDLGIAPQHVLAIGDGENDIEMLRLAGIGVAVGNAVAVCKDAAQYVVASNDEDGVAEAVERFVLAENVGK